MEDMIVLPEDPILMEQLRRKREEYKGRIDPFTHPELQILFLGRVAILALCKIRVMSLLFEKGQLTIEEAVQACLARFGETAWIDEGARQAFDIIADYVTTGGQNVAGGTGLPQAEVLTEPS